MNVGLPGTGLGGLFYLLTSLLMPFIELIQTARGRSSLTRWGRVSLQLALSLGILGGLGATAWLLHHIAPTTHETIRAATQRASQLIGVTPTLLTFMVLGGVLAAVEAAHLLATVTTQLHQRWWSS